MTIQTPSIEFVPIDELKSDGKNPNMMTAAQERALEDSMKKFGVLKPAITNKDLLIADGEHGWKIGKSLGMKTYPVIRLDVGEIDRRMLRQVLNKLHGQHDVRLDIEEFKFLQENNSLSELSSLLVQEEKNLRNLIGLDEPIEIKEKEVHFQATEKKCPKCGYEW